MQRTFSVTWTADTYAALAAPERIDALVLALPPTVWETRDAQADLYENLARLVETEGLASRLALLKQRPLLPPFLLQPLPTLEELSLQHVAPYRSVSSLRCSAVPASRISPPATPSKR